MIPFLQIILFVTNTRLSTRSCPFDIVSIYDGSNETSPLIGQYCGQQRNLVVYSTENYLYVTFDTLQRAANTQNRGFKGMFEFSESFVKLGKFYFNTDRLLKRQNEVK